MVKLAVLGTGRMGQNHLRNLNFLKDVEISFVYDKDFEQANTIAALYQTKALRVLEEAALRELDGVIIVTPTNTHYDYFQQVHQHVKNIFIEKPLSHSLETTETICRRIKENHLNVQIGFIERYNSAVSALRKVVGVNSKIINIDFLRTNKVSSRISDVGVVMDLMIHDIDLAVFLNGKETEVFAVGHVEDGQIDYARSIIKHENGAYSNIVASRITEKRHRNISVTCKDMYVDCNLLSKEVFVNKQTVEQYLEDVSIISKQETIDVRLEESLLLELVDFVALCKGETPAIPTADDGLTAMKLAETIRNQILR